MCRGATSLRVREVDKVTRTGEGGWGVVTSLRMSELSCAVKVRWFSWSVILPCKPV